MNTEGLKALKLVIDALNSAGLPYMLGGSFASSFYGLPRATFDADLVVKLSPDSAAALIPALAGAFYADEEEILLAAEKRTSFNLIHLETAFKVDIFPLKTDAYSTQAFDRRTEHPFLDDGKTSIFLESPEDVILAKLLWHRAGGEVSSKQPEDITGVIKNMGARLDKPYILRWAAELGLKELLFKISPSF